ncbi:2-hydroxyacid dehydrogenase (plasmid) [Komagataeibacter sucrofermentans]|uniref:Dihydrofolate reductase n=1 Tax=Komagataeibacter sucrofermentans TaxID=1053551 RepID=A0A318QD77_9PROT|nr:2-hydroxyacid dehydrogenase [Komagataeibacter sucrofermentans]PYD77567.1 dihydrofolate reductase [Komagataeibacter sucrofermentans]GBQ47410.1 D-isomer-specific 2-hydroxyacid dehydrogenase [Komagataeibacter sucrofermentans DSM 15973]
MKPEILLIEPMMPEIEKQLDAAYTVHRFTSVAQLKESVGRIRGIATGGATGVPEAVMDSLPALEIIAINGIGTDAVDLKKARQRNIHVTTTPGVLTDDVADMAMGLVLSLLRGLPAGDRYVRDGAWGDKPALPLGRKVTGRKLGIIGMGRVGRAIAHRAQAFGMPVSYTDLRDFELEDYAFVPDLPTLARDSEILVIAASGGEGSRHLVNREIMEALGPDGFLVNVARGSVVDEQALIQVLDAGKMGGAALDVFEHEPDVPTPLRQSARVVLQPHRASATVETRLAMGELVVKNLAAHFAGQSLLTAVI